MYQTRESIFAWVKVQHLRMRVWGWLMGCNIKKRLGKEERSTLFAAWSITDYDWPALPDQATRDSCQQQGSLVWDLRSYRSMIINSRHDSSTVIIHNHRTRGGGARQAAYIWGTALCISHMCPGGVPMRLRGRRGSFIIAWMHTWVLK